MNSLLLINTLLIFGLFSSPSLAANQNKTESNSKSNIGCKYSNGTKLKKLVSGGQTGVDRAALDVALAYENAQVLGGGWCPPGRVAEDGLIPNRYPNLKETPEDTSSRTSNVPRSQRTEWNVRDTDATLLLYLSIPNDPGTVATRYFCEQYGKPLMELHLNQDEHAKDITYLKVRRWLAENQVESLNVAGPSERSQEGVYKATYELLSKVLAKEI